MIQFLRRAIHPQVIAAVVGGKEIACFRVESDVKWIAHPGSEDLTLSSLYIEAKNRGVTRVRVVAGITDRTNPDIKPSIGTKLQVVILM